MGFGLFAAAFVGSAVGLWLVSQITEALRPVPQPPKTLRWAPEIPIGYVDIGGCKLRYIKAGRGPNLVLLHTLRTQLDLFEKVVPELARRFTVYALDYPGHGYSDIPEAQYDAEFFAESVAKFLALKSFQAGIDASEAVRGAPCVHGEWGVRRAWPHGESREAASIASYEFCTNNSPPGGPRLTANRQPPAKFPPETS